MSIRCHIIEDEPMASKLLELYVSKLPLLKLIAVSDNPLHALESLKTNPVDLLFLDELPEFQRNVLEVMRQPLEDGSVTISRAAVSVTFPSRFMLAAAMNPCPCGYSGDPTRECHCTPPMIQRYVSKISGLLLDRIDIHIEVPAVKYKELRAPSSAEDSASVRQPVIAARNRQLERFHSEKKTYANTQMMPKMIREHCAIGAPGGMEHSWRSRWAAVSFLARKASKVYEG